MDDAGHVRFPHARGLGSGPPAARARSDGAGTAVGRGMQVGATAWAVARDRWFSLDLRSLGLFRIAFGLCLIGNLYDHAAGGNLVAFFSNDGVLTNHLALFAPIQPRPWSLLFAFSRPGEVVVGFAAILLVYLLYTVGWRTQWMQALVIVCFVSIVNRNLLLQDGGSFTCTLLAVWTLFLPLGARFSVDRWLRVRAAGASPRHGWRTSADAASGPTPDRSPSARPRSLWPDRGDVHVSFVCFALLLQLAAIYGFNAANKSGETWRGGTAVHYILWQLSRNTALAGFLRLHEPAWFSPLLTRATLVFEWTAPLLVLSPVFQTGCRRVLIAGMWILHLGIASLMSLGPFSYAMMAYALLLLRPADWQLLATTRLARGVRRLVARFARHPARAPVLPTPATEGRWGWAARVGREGVAVALFAAMLAELTLANAIVPERLRLGGRPAWMAEVLYYLRIYQTWGMFSADVPTRDGGLVVDAALDDGTHIDPLTGKTPDLEAPLHGPYGLDHDWSEYMFYYPWDRHRAFRGGLRDYALQRVQAHLEARQTGLRSLDIYWVTADCPPPGQTQPRNLTRELMISTVTR